MSLISLFLAQILGVYLVFIGLVLLIRQGDLQHIMIEVFNNRALIFIAGTFTLLIGLIIVLSHNIWEASWVVLITIAGWLTFLKGGMCLFLPQSVLANLLQIFNKRGFYLSGGIASILVGGYLASKGFGVM